MGFSGCRATKPVVSGEPHSFVYWLCILQEAIKLVLASIISPSISSWTTSSVSVYFQSCITQIKVIRLGGRLYQYKLPRMSACDEEVWISQNALKQADRIIQMCWVASLSTNCRVNQKTIAVNSPSDLFLKSQPACFIFLSLLAFLL